MTWSTALKSLILFSLFAPVVGVVTLRLSSDVVYGQPFALVCYTTTRTALYATFYRYQRASDIGINDLLARLGTVSGSTCQPDSANMTKYNYNCSSDGKEISLIVPAENLMEHNTTWKCSNADGPVVTNNNNVPIFVNVPVSSLNLSPYGQVNINEFETHMFTCTTSFCRPQATISWWKNNVNITNTADALTYDMNYTTGSLKYTGNRLDNGETIMCKASNGYGVEKTSQQSAVLNIRYAPVGYPSIGGYSNGSIFSIVENIPQILSCSITGGNPLATLSWNCFGFVGSINIVEQTVTTTITLNVNRNRAGQSCQCLSIHEVQGNRTAVILVEILYSPIVTPFVSPVKVIEHNPLELICRSDGNPTPSVTWIPQGEDTMDKSRLYYHAVTKSNSGTHRCTANSTMRPTNGNTETQSDSRDVMLDILYPPVVIPFASPLKVIANHLLEVICRSSGKPIPDLTWSPLGEDTKNKSRLYYHAIKKSNSGTHRCTANSTMRPINGSQVTGSNASDVVIDVLYPPTVVPFAVPVKVIEGVPLEVICRADGNPTPDLTWSPQGEDTVSKSRLYYHAINKSNSGTHRCTAHSTMKPTSGNPVNVSNAKDVVIDVLYIASIYAFTAKDNNNMIMENDSLQLHCQVDSNPYSDIIIYHEDKLQLKKEEHALKLNYTKKIAECLDAGKYTCHANNSIMNGNSASSDLQIMVACSPRPDHRKNVSTVYYNRLNRNVTLEVYVIAYPEPTNIIWYHREHETDMWQRVTYQPSSSGGLFSSILIHLISMRNFGYYKVTMDNYLGNFSHIYKIIPEKNNNDTGNTISLVTTTATLTGTTAGTGIPEVPKNFSVTESGPDSLTLEWVPGHGGGHPQYFTIEYARHSDGDWLKLDKIWDDGSPMQSFILSGLQQKTTYKLLMYAENKIGRSEKTRVISATTSDKAQAYVFPVAAVAGGISGAVVAVVLLILILIFLRRGGLMNKEKGDDFTRELQGSGKSIKDPVYANSATACIPNGGDYEALKVNRNEVSLYQELSEGMLTTLLTNILPMSIARKKVIALWIKETFPKVKTRSMKTQESIHEIKDEGRLPIGPEIKKSTIKFAGLEINSCSSW